MPVFGKSFLLIVSLFSDAQIYRGVTKHKTVEEYLVTYSEGTAKDTVLKSRTIYDEEGHILDSFTYFRKSVEIHYKYIYNSFVRVPGTNKIIYVVKVGRTEKQYSQGILIRSDSLDIFSSVVKSVRYRLSDAGTPTVQLFLYKYKETKIEYESEVWNSDTLGKTRYLYDNSMVLLEKRTLAAKCCDTQQPIPADNIFFEYDSNHNLIRENAIIDRTIKRKYKDQNDGYYYSATITTFKYDSRNNLIAKTLYAPVISDSSNLNYHDIRPKLVMQQYFYKRF